MQETLWGELSLSSKNALRWAAAMAHIRADRAGSSVDDAEPDEFDLLVGIMLSHPSRSEPRQLLAHVGASAADVLPPGYPLPGKELERYGAEIPNDKSPGLTQPVHREVIFSLAGPVAQYQATADEAAAEAGGGVVQLDQETSRALSEKFGWDVSSTLAYESDYQQAFELLQKATEDQVKSEAWQGWLRIRTDRLVRWYWEQITVVAEALQDRKTLSGGEVRKIVLDSLGVLGSEMR